MRFGNTSVRIVDDDGECAPGTPGEIVAHSPTVSASISSTTRTGVR